MAGGALVALLAGGGLAYELGHHSSYLAPPAHQERQAQPAQAAVALQALADALGAGDADAAAALAPPGDADAAALLRAVAHNADALGVAPTLRYVDQTGGVSADGRWSATAELSWRYAADSGSDPASAEIRVDLAPGRGQRVAVAGFGGDDSRVPVWLAGPVVVRRSSGVLVVLSGSGALARTGAERYLRLAKHAVTVVRRVLPDWHAAVVVEVPDSGAAVDRALGAEPGHTRAIAAVTAPVDGSSSGDSPVHVFVNPDVFDRLRATGAQVVLSHELVHVATDAARSPGPPWLIEGFADYVALRDVPLPVTRTAGQILSQVRRSGVPDSLPGPADFDTTTTHLGATYEGAWLACVVLAGEGGQQALVSLYGDVTHGRQLGEALRERFGLTVAALTRQWQHRLSSLAG